MKMWQRGRKWVAQPKWKYFEAISNRRADKVQEIMRNILTRGKLFKENQEWIEECEEPESEDWKYEPEEENDIARERACNSLQGNKIAICKVHS
jgi:hypothetical protein